jgi:hypothetical protein
MLGVTVHSLLEWQWFQQIEATWKSRHSGFWSHGQRLLYQCFFCLNVSVLLQLTFYFSISYFVYVCDTGSFTWYAMFWRRRVQRRLSSGILHSVVSYKLTDVLGSYCLYLRSHLRVHIDRSMIVMRFQTLRGASAKITILWDISQSSLLQIYRCVRGVYCLRHQGDECPPKHPSTSTRLHISISQKAVIFILAAVRTWNLTLCESV